MKPVHFNCKSAARKRGEKRKRLTPLICSPDIFGSLSIHLHYFHHISLWVFLMGYFLSPPAPTCWSRHVFLRAYLWLSRLSQKAFIFCYIPGVVTLLPPSHVPLPSYLSQCLPSCCWSLLTPVFILISALSSSLCPGSLWEPAYTINISWQHATSSPGPGQLWRLHLLSRPGWSNKACVMQPKPTTQQELSNAGSARNWYEVLTEALFT